jgi:glycosyltransferase involved in cell wall biosynthesis
MKPKIAFVDHYFHKKTQSSAFFIDIIKPHFNIDFFYDDLTPESPPIIDKELIKKEYDTIIFWQIIHKDFILKNMRHINIIIIPMYDQVAFQPLTYWMAFSRVRFFCFSRTLHKKIQLLGIPSFYLQYFIKPSEKPSDRSSDPLCFFWYRHQDVNLELFKQLIGDAPIHSLHIHHAPDPTQPPLLISEEDKRRYRLSVSSWSSSKTEYTQYLKTSDIFFAPRCYEGIGLAMLEAISLGKCVIAPNYPTMNEYIVNDQTGLLYDYQNPQPLDLSSNNINRMIKNTSLYAKEGYDRWNKCAPFISEFILSQEFFLWSMIRVYLIIPTLFLLYQIYRIKKKIYGFIYSCFSFFTFFLLLFS